MKLSMIVAVSENNVIGLHGEMPWKKIPADLRFFRTMTTGHWCILGRKTFEALGNTVLPGRKFIVVTRKKDFSHAEVVVAHSLPEAFENPVLREETEVFILGGGEIYREALYATDKIYMTRVHASFPGDTFFPELSKNHWKLTEKKSLPKGDATPYDIDFETFERTDSSVR